MKHPGMSRKNREKWERFLALPVPKGGATYQKIADAAGCSKERVRQIEAQALKKLEKLLVDHDDSPERSAV